MRKTVLMLNGFVIVFFVCFLAYTLVARAHMNHLAKAYAVETTVKHAKPMVDVAEKALKSPVVKALLPNEQEEMIGSEIDQYRKDPAAYVSDLAKSETLKVPPTSSNPMVQKVLGLKAKIKGFYDDTLHALIRDLRIFSTCNLIAALIAFGMAVPKSVRVSTPLLCFSIIIFMSVLYCSYIYVDDLSFFAILHQSYMGWSYGGLLIFMIIWVFFENGFGLWLDVRESLARETKTRRAKKNPG